MVDAGADGLVLGGGDEAFDEDVDGEPLTLYTPGTLDIASVSSSPDLLAVIEEDGTDLLCLAVPVLERDGGLLITVPRNHASCIPGPHLPQAVVGATFDQPELPDDGVQLLVDLIDVAEEHFNRLACIRGIEDVPTAGWFDMDSGVLPHAMTLAAAAETWLRAAAAGPLPGGNPRLLADAGSSDGFRTAAEAAPARRGGRGAGRAGGRASRAAPAQASAARAGGGRRTVTAVAGELDLLRAEVERLRALVPGAQGGQLVNGVAAGAMTPGGPHVQQHPAPPPTPPPPALPGGPPAPGASGQAPAPGAAAAAARERARGLLGQHGVPAQAPQALPQGRAQPQQANLDALLQQATGGGADAATALRLLEIQALQAAAEALSGRRGRQDQVADLDGLFEGMAGETDTDGVGPVRLTRGSESMQRVLRNIERHPELWNQHFDTSVWRTLRADITGAPWSLLDYVGRRMYFRREDDDLERVTHIFCHLHALHRAGPDQHAALGAAITQGFKALEQRMRDGVWTVGWLWTGIPEPRPGPMTRSLAHPAEHAAAIAYVRELQTLQTFRSSLATPAPTTRGGPAWVPGGGTATLAGGGQPGGAGADGSQGPPTAAQTARAKRRADARSKAKAKAKAEAGAPAGGQHL